MTEQERIEKAARESDRLAALACEPLIALGASDREVGPAVLAAHLSAELAAAHRMVMQLAAAAGTVLDWPDRADDVHAAEAPVDTTPAALLGAQLAGAACRLMEQIRQGLPALALPPEAGAHLQALAWAGDLCPAEELERRFQAARAAVMEMEPAIKLSEAGRTIRDNAAAATAELAGAAADLAHAIAADGGAFIRRLFAHELAAGHGLVLRLAGRFDVTLERAARDRREPRAALRLAGAVARIMARLRRGRATLAQAIAAAEGKPPTGGGRGKGPKIYPFWAGSEGYRPEAPEPAATAGHGVLCSDSLSGAVTVGATGRSPLPEIHPRSSTFFREQIQPISAGHLRAVALRAKAGGVLSHDFHSGRGFDRESKPTDSARRRLPAAACALRLAA